MSNLRYPVVASEDDVQDDRRWLRLGDLFAQCGGVAEDKHLETKASQVPLQLPRHRFVVLRQDDGSFSFAGGRREH